MKKMVKKFFSTLLIIFIVSSLFCNVKAANLNTTLKAIQQESNILYLENNQGNLSKKIVDLNSNSGDVTIELKLSNISKETEQSSIYENTEIYLLVSENIANDETRLTKTIQNIELLSSKIFNENSKTKIGIIGITGTINDTIMNENGNLITGDKDEHGVNGSSENAEIVEPLTNNLDDLKNRIERNESFPYKI